MQRSIAAATCRTLLQHSPVHIRADNVPTLGHHPPHPCSPFSCTSMHTATQGCPPWRPCAGNECRVLGMPCRNGSQG